MKFKKIIIALMATVFLIGGNFANGLTKINAQEKKHVVTTFYPVYYLTKEIAGDKMDVTMLLDGNQDAHDFEPSSKDIAMVSEADALIYQSDEMEHFVGDIKQSIDTNKTKVVMSTEGIELLKGSGHAHEDHAHEGEEHEGEDHAHEGEEHEGEEHDHEGEEHEGEDHDHEGEEGHHHEFDPHTWTDPMTYAKQVDVISKSLIEIDPDNADTYSKNAEKLVGELTKLDQEYKEKLANRKEKTIVVQHAAFGYMAHAYGLEQESITGISTTQEPSAAVLAEMQNFVKEHKVKVIYVEPSLDKAIAETVAKASGAEIRPLRTLESLSQEDKDKGLDYLSIMRENLKQLAE